MERAYDNADVFYSAQYWLFFVNIAHKVFLALLSLLNSTPHK